MLSVPPDLARRYEAVLKRSAVASLQRGYYRKWLRYYLDFCHKYGFDPADRNSVSDFNNKLRDKRQSDWLRRQAHHAVSLYYEMVEEPRREPTGAGCPATEEPARAGEVGRTRTNHDHSAHGREAAVSRDDIETSQTDNGLMSSHPRPVPVGEGAESGRVVEASRGVDLPRDPTLVVPSSHPVTGQRRLSPTRYPSGEPKERTAPSPQISEHGDGGYTVLKQSGVSWIELYNKLESSIKVRHYSPKTLVAYGSWIRKLQAFTKSKDPRLLSTNDVRDFLSFLAVKKKVSASNQNQTFNA